MYSLMCLVIIGISVSLMLVLLSMRFYALADLTEVFCKTVTRICKSVPGRFYY